MDFCLTKYASVPLEFLFKYRTTHTLGVWGAWPDRNVRYLFLLLLQTFVRITRKAAYINSAKTNEIWVVLASRMREITKILEMANRWH